MMCVCVLMLFLNLVEFCNLRCCEGLPFQGAAPRTDCFGPHSSWQAVVTSALILLSLCSWSSHLLGFGGYRLHRAWRLWQTFREVSMLEEKDSVKKVKRVYNSWQIASGNISVARSQCTDERMWHLSFCLSRWGSSHATFMLFQQKRVLYEWTYLHELLHLTVIQGGK